MNRLFAVALTTFRENYRNNFFISLLGFGLGLVSLSLVLGEMSFAEGPRILFDVGLTAIHWLILIMCIFMGSFTLQREFERQTYMTLLASPLKRGEFLFGKILGLGSLILLTVCFLALLLLFLLSPDINVTNYLAIIYGMLLEGLVLLACAVLFALVLAPVLGILCAFSIWLVGNWLDDLTFFAQKANDVYYQKLVQFFKFAFPHLQDTNWRYFHLLAEGVAPDRILLVTLHHLAWVLFLFGLAYFVFNRKKLT